MNELPMRWKVSRLSDVAAITMGQSPPGNSYNGEGEGVPFFQGKSEFGNLTATVRTWTTAGTKFAKAGDILLSVRAPVGPTNLAPVDCALGRGLAGLHAGSDLEQRFLMWNLRAQEHAISALGKGSTFEAITGKQLRDVTVPVPPMEEQRRIVEILEDHLSRLDAAERLLRDGQNRLEAWKRVKVDGLVRECASGTTSLGALVARVEAGRSLGGSAPPAGPGEWGIIKVSAMTWGEFRPEENKKIPAEQADPRYEIRPGDVLVSRANTAEYVGAPVYVELTPERLLLSDKSLRLVPNNGIDSRWLLTVLAARSTRAQVSRLATGTKDSMRNISQQSLLSVTVPEATPIQQGHAIRQASLLEDSARTLRTEVERAQLRGRALRRALLGAAFSGRLT